MQVSEDLMNLAQRLYGDNPDLSGPKSEWEQSKRRIQPGAEW